MEVFLLVVHIKRVAGNDTVAVECGIVHALISTKWLSSLGGVFLKLDMSSILHALSASLSTVSHFL